MKVKRLAILLLLLLAACSSPPSAPSRSQSLTAGNTTNVEPSPPTATPVPPPAEPLGGLSWQEASAHVGEVSTVCGPVAGTSYRPDVNGEPTFLNIGEDYPSPSRFTLVIWGEDRGNFSQAPEDTYRGASVCATGEIEEFRGVAQMELSSPNSLTIE